MLIRRYGKCLWVLTVALLAITGCGSSTPADSAIDEGYDARVALTFVPGHTASPTALASGCDEASFPPCAAEMESNRLASATGEECGTVRMPASGAVLGVYVVAGDIGCDEAGSVINRYLMDPGLERGGNTQTAEFLGWLCASPTAAAADRYGYAIQCTREGDEIQVR